MYPLAENQTPNDRKKKALNKWEKNKEVPSEWKSKDELKKMYLLARNVIYFEH